MSRSGRSWGDIRALARELLQRGATTEPELIETLRTDIVAAVSRRTDLEVVRQPPGTLVTGCTIGGAYIRRRPPTLPRIVLCNSGDCRRDRFTLGHEFCHHLIDHDPILADLLFSEPDRGRALEEDICSSAAAYLLVRGTDVDTAIHQNGVTALAARHLHEVSQGSLEVCCIALGHRMTEPGHILVCDPDPDDANTVMVRFTARGPDAIRTPDHYELRSSLFAAAIHSGTASGTIEFGTDHLLEGWRHADISGVGQTVVCVVTAGQPTASVGTFLRN